MWNVVVSLAKTPEKRHVQAGFVLSYGIALLATSVAAIGRAPYRWAGDILVITSVAGVVISVALYWRYRIVRRRWTETPKRAELYQPNEGVGKLPRPGDVELVIDKAHESIPSSLFYSPEQLAGFIAVNPGALRCIRTRGDSSLTGYYILLALSERGEGLLKDGAVDVGVAMPASLTVPNPLDARAFYIGMVQGMSYMGQAETRFALVTHLDQIATENHSDIRVYARPGHASSRRLMDHLGFKPVRYRGRALEIEWTTVKVGQLATTIENYRRRQHRWASHGERHSGETRAAS